MATLPTHGRLSARAARGAAVALVSLTCGLWSGPALAGPPETPVTVERIRPKKDKRPTLRFLKDNLDFVRSRLDALRQLPRRTRDGANEIDPRFLDYRGMLAQVQAAGDSLKTAEDLRAKRDMFASVGDLAELEAELDLMDRLLLEQRTRLAALQQDYTGRQQTALAVVLSGDAGVPVSEVVLTLEDGDTLTVALDSGQRESLRRGGILEVFHGLVEPREQFVEIALRGEGWASGGAGFVTLTPDRDRLVYLKLDLTPARPAEGAASLKASTWVHDATLPLGGRTESEP